LSRCWLRKHQWKTVSLSIQKSAAMVQSFFAVLFFVFTKIESLLTQKTSMKLLPRLMLGFVSAHTHC
jgi:hypothetical protein